MTDTVNFSLKIKDEQLLTQPCVGAQRLASLVGYLDLSVLSHLRLNNQIHTRTIP